MNEERPSLEELRAAFASLSTNAAPGPDCPAPDSIWEALLGEIPARPAAAIVEHTSGCHACAEAWRLGRTLAGERSAGARVTAFSSPAFGVWTGLAAVAFLLLVVGIVVLMPSSVPKPDVTRAGEETAIRSLVEGTAPLPRAACLLRWSEPAAGARYTLRIGMQDLTPIASAQGFEQPEYLVPAKSLVRLPPGALLVWRVEADLPDGRRIVSQAFLNRIE